MEPYADVYASIKYGSYLVQSRSARNKKTTLPCPLDNVNDTEIYIYSASQLADVGDLSGLMVGYADFSKAVKLQALKIGDADPEYSNGNLTELYLGNNELLRTLDVRNCPNLTQAVDISGCANIEHVYFDGTAITGLELPKGGIIKTLHLPETLTSLSVLDHAGITDFVLPSVDNLSTCRLENVGDGIDTKAMINALPARCRVRLIGFDWTVANEAELSSLKDVFDTMRGLNEAGGNEDIAQLYGRIHIITITGAVLKEFRESYPDVSILYSNITSKCYFYNYDGTTLLYTANSINGSNVNYTGSTPSRPATAQYNFTFAGWSRTIDGAVDPDAQKHVVEDRNLYAVFTGTIRTYTVRFYVGNSVVLTRSNVPYGSTVHYDGETPTNTDVPNPEDYAFTGWDVSTENIQGDVNCYAVFAYIGYAYKQLLDGNTNGIVELTAPTEIGRYGLSYLEDTPTIILPNVETVGYRAFYFASSGSNTKSISLPKATDIGEQAFYNQKVLETVDLSRAEILGKQAFQGCTSLQSIDLPEVTEIGESCFQSCSALEDISMPNVVQIKNAAFSSASSLKSLTLPETLTRIGQSAFAHCRSLEEVMLPESLTYLDQLAFSSCTGLKRVIFKGKPNTINGGNIFGSCTALEDIYVPWEYGQVARAPWGATNATIHYVDEGWQAELFPEQGEN